MTHNFVSDETSYWIAHEPGAIQGGTLEAGVELSTGLIYFETYSTHPEQQLRLHKLETDYTAALAEWLETLRLRDPLALLADYRWQKETGGLILTTGPRIRTDRTSQSQMTSTLTALAEGMVAEPVPWKAESGWVNMTRAELKAAATEVATHVSKCFAAEEAVAAQLATDPDLDVKATFDAVYAGM